MGDGDGRGERRSHSLGDGVLGLGADGRLVLPFLHLHLYILVCLLDEFSIVLHGSS